LVVDVLSPVIHTLPPATLASRRFGRTRPDQDLSREGKRQKEKGKLNFFLFLLPFSLERSDMQGIPQQPPQPERQPRNSSSAPSPREAPAGFSPWAIIARTLILLLAVAWV
jgi:hypothetical protein